MDASIQQKLLINPDKLDSLPAFDAAIQTAKTCLNFVLA
jgi:hypothetical protein